MKKLLFQKICTILILLKIKNIDAFKYKLREFALIIFYIFCFNQKKLEIYICIKCILYLIKGLKANMFISNNIFYIKSFLINFANIFAYILIYRVNIVINARYYSKFLK